MVVTGATMLLKVMKMHTPMIKKEKYHQEAFDRNQWKYLHWKRSLLVIAVVAIIVIETCKVFLSFSSIYANNLWYWLSVNKLWNSLVCMFLQKTLKEVMLINPISVALDCVENLITWGSATFLDFLVSYLFNLGIQMFERTYFTHMMGIILSFLENTWEKLRNYLKK